MARVEIDRFAGKADDLGRIQRAGHMQGGEPIQRIAGKYRVILGKNHEIMQRERVIQSRLAGARGAAVAVIGKNAHGRK